MASYEEDFYAWTQAQAEALRTTKPNHLDWANIAEELETLGRNERLELESRLRVTLTHLLKWRYQSWMRTRSWDNTLRVQRRDLEKVLKESPSLRPQVPEAITEEYEAASLKAYDETNLPDGTFPADCPFTPDQVMDPDYTPEADDRTRSVSPGAT